MEQPGPAIGKEAQTGPQRAYVAPQRAGEAVRKADLGLPAELASLTDGSAKHWITLSHYAIVTRDPGGKAA